MVSAATIRQTTETGRNWSEWAYGRHWMGLHKLHSETNLGLKPQCYRDGLWDTTITLCWIGWSMGDVHGAIVKGWPEVAGTLGSGRQTSELCLPWCIDGFTVTSLAQFPAFSSRFVGSCSKCCRPVTYILQSSHRPDVKLYLTCNSATYRFWDIRGQMAFYYLKAGSAVPKYRFWACVRSVVWI